VDDRAIVFRFLAGTKDFILNRASRPSLGNIQTPIRSYSVVSGPLATDVNRAGRGVGGGRGLKLTAQLHLVWRLHGVVLH
jgi:hypothetical protein